ncbi:MAG: GFA family protein [Actinomycetota bacterium]
MAVTDHGGSAGGGATGGCLCGAVRFTVNGPVRDVWNCHCEHCRRSTGNHMAATAAEGADLEIVESGSLTWYSHQPGVFYGFCARCGSSLFWRTQSRATVSICAGALDDVSQLRAGGVLFASEAAGYVTHPDVPVFPSDREVPDEVCS